MRHRSNLRLTCSYITPHARAAARPHAGASTSFAFSCSISVKTIRSFFGPQLLRPGARAAASPPADQLPGRAGRLGQGDRPAALARQLLLGAAEPHRRRCRAGKVQRRRGCAAEPPSSTSEACGRQEDVSQLTCFARRPAGCWEMDCQRAGGQRRRAPVSSSLMSAEPLSGCSPLRKAGRSTARCARGLYGGP